METIKFKFSCRACFVSVWGLYFTSWNLMGYQIEPFCLCTSDYGCAVYCGRGIFFFFQICLCTTVIYIFFLKRKGVPML